MSESIEVTRENRRGAKRAASGPVAPSNGQRLLRILWLMAVIVVAVCWLIPSDSAPIQTLAKLNLSDKFEHVIAYAAIAFLPALHEKRDFMIAVAIGALALGIGLEFGQRWLEWRTFEYGDMVADAVGIVAGFTAGLPLRSTAFVQALLRKGP